MEIYKLWKHLIQKITSEVQAIKMAYLLSKNSQESTCARVSFK